MVFFVLRLIDWLVPDVPESLELKVKRERYLAKQALADNQEALLVSDRRHQDQAIHRHPICTGLKRNDHKLFRDMLSSSNL